jgi:hypothetical protein
VGRVGCLKPLGVSQAAMQMIQQVSSEVKRGDPAPLDFAHWRDRQAWEDRARRSADKHERKCALNGYLATEQPQFAIDLTFAHQDIPLEGVMRALRSWHKRLADWLCDAGDTVLMYGAAERHASGAWHLHTVVAVRTLGDRFVWFTPDALRCTWKHGRVFLRYLRGHWDGDRMIDHAVTKGVSYRTKDAESDAGWYMDRVAPSGQGVLCWGIRVKRAKAKTARAGQATHLSAGLESGDPHSVDDAARRHDSWPCRNLAGDVARELNECAEASVKRDTSPADTGVGAGATAVNGNTPPLATSRLDAPVRPRCPLAVGSGA